MKVSGLEYITFPVNSYKYLILPILYLLIFEYRSSEQYLVYLLIRMRVVSGQFSGLKSISVFNITVQVWKARQYFLIFRTRMTSHSKATFIVILQ